MIDFDGKVILITGAAHGQGRATAALLQRYGAQVVATDLQAPVQDSDEGVQVVSAELDIADRRQWLEVVGDVGERFGRLDGLVNNAGILITETLEEFDLERARHLADVNQWGAVLGMQACAELLAASRGSVVNIASTAAVRGFAGRISYSASKWALRGLSRAAAAELAPRGVRVNCVLPGLIDTPMAALNPPEFNRLLASQIPVGRLGSAEEVAAATAFLLSDAASYVTGAELVVDGGATT